MSIPLNSWSPVLVTRTIANYKQHVYAYLQLFSRYRRANIGKSNQFLEGCLSLALACAGLLESTESESGLLKSAFNAENFMCKLSWSI